jgi:hypothetical protein
MKNILFFGFTVFGLFHLSACLPLIMDNGLNTAPAIAEVDKKFNRSAALHRYGAMPTDWLADQRHQLYAGVATPVRLNVSERALVTVSTGTIRRDSVEKDLFYIESEFSGVTAQVSAKEFTKTGESEQIWSFSILPLPLPILRLPIQNNNGNLSVSDVHKLRSFELLSSVAAKDVIDFLCPCQSFVLDKISKEGARSEAQSPKGDFNSDIVALLQRADAGDIYIFKQIKTACTPKERVRTLPNYAFYIQ